MKASNIAKFLKAELVGKDFEVKGIGKPSSPVDYQLWYFKKKFRPFHNIIGLYILNQYVEVEPSKTYSFIKVDNPKLAFARVIWEFFKDIPKKKVIREVPESSSVVHSFIGHAGFGFAKQEDGTWLRMPHLGAVKIGKDVEIGAGCTIARGTLDDTIIGDGVKIDDGCHIAHNCIIGKNTIICANACFSGSVTVGEDCWIAPNVSIIDHIKIGNRCKIGIGAVVTNDVPDDTTIMGVPAMPLKELAKHMKREPDIRRENEQL